MEPTVWVLTAWGTGRDRRTQASMSHGAGSCCGEGGWAEGGPDPDSDSWDE